MTTDPVARYRAASARIREMETAGSKAPWQKFIGGNFTEVLCGPRQDDRANRVCQMRSYNPASEHVFGEDCEVEHKNARLICASRNLLFPLLDAGDRIAARVERGNHSWTCPIVEWIRPGRPGTGKPCDCGLDDDIVTLAALTDALERECGGAQ